MQEHVKLAPATDGVSRIPDATRGFFFALFAYLMWGFLPLYMKAISYIPPVEIIAHRIVWSVPVAGIVLLMLGRTGDIKVAFRQPRTLAMAALTAAIITINWGVYVWAIAADRAVETALGYYINPLVSMVFGALFLKERFTRLQMVALMLATLAVVVLTVDAGGLPWVSLVLAFSFAIYGFLRKTLPVGPSQGFFLEVLILCLPCLVYIFWLEETGQGHFFDSSFNFLMLLASGIVTAVPLILFAFGAKLLRISTIGIMQYLAPTMIALIGVFMFGEPFGTGRMIAFALIVSALVLYTWSMLFGAKPEPKDGR